MAVAAVAQGVSPREKGGARQWSVSTVAYRDGTRKGRGKRPQIEGGIAMKSQDKDALEFVTLAFCLIGSLAALSSGEFWAAKKVHGKSDVEIGYGRGGRRFQLQRIQLQRIQLWRIQTLAGSHS